MRREAPVNIADTDFSSLKRLSTKIGAAAAFSDVAHVNVNGLSATVNVTGVLNIIADMTVKMFRDYAPQLSFTSTLGQAARLHLTTDDEAVRPDLPAISQAILDNLSPGNCAQCRQVTLYLINEVEHRFDNAAKVIKWQ